MIAKNWTGPVCTGSGSINYNVTTGLSRVPRNPAAFFPTGKILWKAPFFFFWAGGLGDPKFPVEKNFGQRLRQDSYNTCANKIYQVSPKSGVDILDFSVENMCSSRINSCFEINLFQYEINFGLCICLDTGLSNITVAWNLLQACPGGSAIRSCRTKKKKCSSFLRKRLTVLDVFEGLWSEGTRFCH